MAYDAELSPNAKIRLTLQRARDAIAKHGLCKNMVEDSNGSMCSVGALLYSMNGDAQWSNDSETSHKNKIAVEDASKGPRL